MIGEQVDDRVGGVHPRSILDVLLQLRYDDQDVALGLGLLAVNLVGPGRGMNVDPASLDTKAIATYTAASAKPVGFVDFLLNLVPTSIVDAANAAFNGLPMPTVNM